MMAFVRGYVSKRATTVLVAGALAVLAAAVAGHGMAHIPLTSHEIYVAQTAQNMLDSGNWLVPRLNGHYRLTKPTLSYWLVASAAWLSGASDIGPALARLPSVFAAMGLVLLTFWLGMRLFDRRTGGLAALMALSSLALFKYGHNGRPDMLYAFWTTAMLAAWIGARQASRVRDEFWWISALWVLFALAALTKGPQAPLILLAGVMLHSLLTGGQWRALLRLLRPVRGVLVVLTIALPWWLALRAAVGAETLASSQLSGELLSINPLRIFTPFYLLRAPLLWLPWTLLLPCTVLVIWRNRRGHAGFMAFLVIVAMLVFALGPQYRQIYLLPWLAPAMLALAAGATQTSVADRWLWLPWSVGVFAWAWLLWQGGIAAWVLVPAGACLLVAAVRALWRRLAAPGAALIAAAAALALFVGGTVPALWSEARYAQPTFSQSLWKQIDPAMPIAVWNIDPASYAYYFGRPVASFWALGPICRWLEKLNVPALLIYPAEQRETLQAILPLNPVLETRSTIFAATRLPAHAACKAQPGT
jgi:4-amino-4-deoxy-L-arabinose transferase-like glycosyltransferase